MLRCCRKDVKQQSSRKIDNKHDVPRKYNNMDSEIIKKYSKEGKKNKMSDKKKKSKLDDGRKRFLDSCIQERQKINRRNNRT